MPEATRTPQTLTWTLTPDTFYTIQRLKLLEGEPNLYATKQCAYTERWITGLELQYQLEQTQIHLVSHSAYGDGLLDALRRNALPALPEPTPYAGPNAVLMLGRNRPEAFAWLQVPRRKQHELLQNPRFLQELAFALTATPSAVRPLSPAPRMLIYAEDAHRAAGNLMGPSPLEHLLDLPTLAAWKTVLQDLGESLWRDKGPHQVDATMASLRLDALHARQTLAQSLLQAWKGASQ